MKLRLYCLALALCAFAPTAFADIALPAPTPTPEKVRRAASLPAARMSIESRNDATEARLQIPRSVLRQLRAEIDRDDAFDAAATNAPLRPAQTIIAGIFLSLSLAFAGILIVRTRSRNTKRAAAVALVVVIAASGTLAIKTLANARPPEPRTLDAGSLKRATTPDEELKGLIRVEIVPEGNSVKLIVPVVPAAASTGSK